MAITGDQLRAARVLVRREQSELAAEAGVSTDTIKRLERFVGAVSANISTVDAVVAALRLFGAEFTNGGQPGVRPRLPDSYTDEELTRVLDHDGVWLIRGAPNPLPANDTTLRSALARARPLHGPDQKVTSIRSLGDGVIIPIEQVKRLWSGQGIG